jgi:acyl-CoA thioesterase FadM
VECDFRAPVTLDELLVVEAYFAKIGETSIHIAFEAKRKGAGDDRGHGQIRARDRARSDFKTVPVPDAVRAALAPYAESRKLRGGFIPSTMSEDLIDLRRAIALRG